MTERVVPVKTEQFEFAEEHKFTYAGLQALHREGNRLIAEEAMTDRRRLAIGRVMNHIAFEIVMRENDLAAETGVAEIPVQEEASEGLLR